MSDETETTYRIYRMRWIQLVIYILATFANAINSVTFAPIEKPTTIFYGISAAAVNALAIVFLFLYVIGTIISIWLSRKIINACDNDCWIDFEFGLIYTSILPNFSK